MHDLYFYSVFPILFTLFLSSTLLKFKRLFYLLSLIFSSKDISLNCLIYMVYSKQIEDTILRVYNKFISSQREVL